MSRYIYADGIDIRAREGYDHDGVLYLPYRDVRKSLDSAPSIDICFCRECKWENTQKCPPHRMGLIHDDSDYCSYGIRRSDDE